MMLKRNIGFNHLGLSAFVIATVLSLAACHTDEGESVKVGTILGLTGNYAAYGVKMKRGFEFALDEIDAPGTGAKLELSIEDSQFDPAKAISAYRKLTSVDGIRIIVGITGSKNAIPVCEAAKGESVVIVDALSSAPMITKVCGDNYFRIMASDALAGKYNVAWAMESGMTNPAIVYMEDDWGVSYRDSLLEELGQKGFNNVPVFSVTAGTRDFRTEVEKINARAPDTIFLLLYAGEGSVFMQQLRQRSIQATVYGSDNISSAEFVAMGKTVVEGVRVAMPARIHGPMYDSFSTKYKAKYGEEPDANVIKSYDAMDLVAEVVRQVGSEPTKIQQYLHSPGFQYQGVSGTIKFDARGDLVSQEYTRMVYHSGNLVAEK